MTSILGISAFYHDSAAALVVDGRIVAAAQEERFTRKKGDAALPFASVEYCLDCAGLKIDDVDYICFYEKPLNKFERLVETYLAFTPAGYRSFRAALPLWLREKLYHPHMIRSGLGIRHKRRLVFADHHQSHAASAFFPSPFQQAAILTLDGTGEWSTTCWGVGRDNQIELRQEQRFPHSLGLLYSAFTYYTGFRVNSGEYKVMGLAPYGNPVYVDQIVKHLIDLKPDGSFRMDMSYFNYCQGLTMTSKKFDRLFGGPPRKPESLITQREMDLAASLQAVTEEVMLRLARHVHGQTKLKNLVLAGGVALNCVGNGRILREGPFENIWIQPAAGDAGGALGCALLTWFQLLGNARSADLNDMQQGSLLGPAYDDAYIQGILERDSVSYVDFPNDDKLCEYVAHMIADEKVVGWFQGRMEFGPRALGARSILGDARSPRMQSVMNLKIKFRESFRPFAPIVLAEHAHQYFELKEGQQSPYMLIVAPVRHELRRQLSDEYEQAFGIDKLNFARSTIPAVTHVDYSARVQTVDQRRHSLLHRLLTKFYERTGCAVLVNTSFNVRGEPIVCTPDDALRCFRMTDMDALVLGKFVVVKQSSQQNASQHERDQHLAAFSPD